MTTTTCPDHPNMATCYSNLGCRTDQARENHRQQRRRYASRRPDMVDSDAVARRVADQLERGERIGNYSNHHSGMRELKRRLGDPAPAGMTLSLVVFDGPNVYTAFGGHDGSPRLVSNDPADYVWESLADNNARDRARRREVPA